MINAFIEENMDEFLKSEQLKAEVHKYYEK